MTTRSGISFFAGIVALIGTAVVSSDMATQDYAAPTDLENEKVENPTKIPPFNYRDDNRKNFDTTIPHTNNKEDFSNIEGIKNVGEITPTAYSQKTTYASDTFELFDTTTHVNEEREGRVSPLDTVHNASTVIKPLDPKSTALSKSIDTIITQKEDIDKSNMKEFDSTYVSTATSELYIEIMSNLQAGDSEILGPFMSKFREVMIYATSHPEFSLYLEQQGAKNFIAKVSEFHGIEHVITTTNYELPNGLSEDVVLGEIARRIAPLADIGGLHTWEDQAKNKVNEIEYIDSLHGMLTGIDLDTTPHRGNATNSAREGFERVLYHLSHP